MKNISAYTFVGCSAFSICSAILLVQTYCLLDYLVYTPNDKANTGVCYNSNILGFALLVVLVFSFVMAVRFDMQKLISRGIAVAWLFASGTQVFVISGCLVNRIIQNFNPGYHVFVINEFCSYPTVYHAFLFFSCAMLMINCYNHCVVVVYRKIVSEKREVSLVI